MSDNNIAPEIQEILWERVKQYNRSTFIDDDPISIPHRFSQKKDIEISAFFAATLAWGQRKTIIKSTNTLMSIFDNAPFDFISHVTESEIEGIPKFVHRTFNTEDLKFFIRFFKRHYSEHESLEAGFFPQRTKEIGAVKLGLIHFHNTFFEGHLASRTKKHVSTPSKNSACKRLNMFLRWMVRPNDGVDFGLWNNIDASQLMIPLDVHVQRVAINLGLISSEKSNWATCEQLTEQLCLLHPSDPTIFDYALFGFGVEERQISKKI
jgi:uncharacterized protein (TIGR02757 family)